MRTGQQEMRKESGSCRSGCVHDVASLASLIPGRHKSKTQTRCACMRNGGSSNSGWWCLKTPFAAEWQTAEAGWSTPG
eukprot:scaffold182199_cov18-Tisochrysis_lutea.AAC.1